MNVYKTKLNRKPNKVALFCNARDEKDIKEWAAHHLLIGFDIIIIFDHKSKHSLNSIFSKFDKRVTIVQINTEKQNIKNMLMNKAAKLAIDLNIDWFIYLDADEFIILNKKFKGIKHFLNTYSYADSIGINWLMFGSNYFVNDPSGGLLLENYKMSQQLLDKHLKSFVRPSEIKNCVNPHFYNMRNPSKMIGIDFKILNKPYCFNEINIPFYNSPIYIAHYVYQSEQTYRNRKILINADNGMVRENLGKKIHELYNDGINLQPQKYVNSIKNFLNYYS